MQGLEDLCNSGGKLAKLVDHAHESAHFMIDLGVFISKTAEVLLGSADIPFASMIWPRNVRDCLLNSHLSGFSINPAAWMR